MDGSATAEEREEELSSISAIFPELQIDAADPFKATLDIPVHLAEPLVVSFPAATDGAPPDGPPTPPSSENDGLQVKEGKNELIAPSESYGLSHLPSLRLEISLPAGYPNEQPPHFDLHCEVQWLPQNILENLKEEGPKLWEEYGRSQVVYGYIDYLQQAAERAFDLSENGTSSPSLPLDLQTALLDYDKQAKKEKFDRETFDCGVCLDPKKGSVCYQMARCKHVFCVACLQDFYNNAILEGDVTTVRCLDPSCGKEPGVARSKKKLRTLSPSELLQIPLEYAAVKRYVDLKRKKKIEADKTTTYCPRSWCQGPARSKKYPRITSFDNYVDSDDEEPSPPQSDQTLDFSTAERLAVCEDCQFAFCRRCLAGWHGDYVRCWPRSKEDLTEEEQATYNYIRRHTSPCPTCSSPVQKSRGCNHMTCFQCRSHFCYLCSSWLMPDNPYSHFNKPKTPCYQRLWELDEGDNGDNGQFQGPRGWEQDLVVGPEAEAEEIVQDLAIPPPAPDPPAAAGAPPRVADAIGLANEMNRLHIRPAPVAVGPEDPAPLDQEPRRGLALQRFLQMAQNNEEEDWDSDELDDEDDEFAHLR